MKRLFAPLAAVAFLVMPAGSAAGPSVPQVIQSYLSLKPAPDGNTVDARTGLRRYVWLTANKDLKAASLVLYASPKDPGAWGIVLADAKRPPSDYVGTTNLKGLGSPDGTSQFAVVRAGKFQNALLIASPSGLAGERVVTVCTYAFLRLTAPGAADWVVQQNR